MVIKKQKFVGNSTIKNENNNVNVYFQTSTDIFEDSLWVSSMKYKQYKYIKSIEFKIKKIFTDYLRNRSIVLNRFSVSQTGRVFSI